MECSFNNKIIDDYLTLEKNAKLLAFWAIVIATVAIVSTVVTIPALYSAAHNLNAELLQESDFCRLQVRDFWLKMYSLGIPVNNLKWKREAVLPQQNNRPKRHWLFGKWIAPSGVEHQQDSSGYGSSASYPSPAGYDSEVNVPNIHSNVNQLTSSNYNDKNQYGLEIAHKTRFAKPKVPTKNLYDGSPAYPPSISPSANHPTVVESSEIQSVCSCQCQFGPPGPPDGLDGKPGNNGKDGQSGIVIVTQRDIKNVQCECPTGPMGEPGPQGNRGPPGPRGLNGLPGLNGIKGKTGMQGSPGPVGPPGPLGLQGNTGTAGQSFQREAIRGPQGKPGNIGPKGSKGCQGPPGGTVTGLQGLKGNRGRVGHDGHKGIQGPDGIPGEKGPDGDCSHCPIPRTPPGY